MSLYETRPKHPIQYRDHQDQDLNPKPTVLRPRPKYKPLKIWPTKRPTSYLNFLQVITLRIVNMEKY